MAYFFASSVVLLASGVIWGWITDNRFLIQIFPSFAPMQLNTALCFFFCGIGLLFHKYRRFPLSEICAGVVITIATMTILEYVLDMNLGIDEFFMNSPIHTKVSHSGRMAPNTALSFLISGLSIIFCRQRQILLILTSTLLMFSLLALFGYIFNMEGLYGVGTLTRMAIHTCTGFILLALCLFSIQRSTTKVEVDLWEISPNIVFAVFMTLTIFSWYSISESYQNQNKDYFHSLVVKRTQAIEKRFALYEQSLLGGGGFINGSPEVSRREWKAYVDSLNIKENLPGNNGMGFIDSVDSKDLNSYLKKVQHDGYPSFKNHPETSYPDKFIIKYIEPLEMNKPAVGLDIGFESHRREGAEEARDTGRVTLTKKITLIQDNKKLVGFLLLAPVYNTTRTPSTIRERRKNFRGCPR